MGLILNEDRFITELILNGSLEFSGIDQESGEVLYRFTDKLKDFSPELHNESNLYFTQEMMELWEYGFIEMDITERNPIVRITGKALNDEEIQNLKTSNRLTLKEIIKFLKSKK